MASTTQLIKQSLSIADNNLKKIEKAYSYKDNFVTGFKGKTGKDEFIHQ
jgi:hypothetical protein